MQQMAAMQMIPGQQPPPQAMHAAMLSQGGVMPICSRSLYVGGLSPKITEDLLYEIFATIGPIETCKVIKDKITGQSAGYGFVDYFDPQSAALAMQVLNCRVIYGEEIKVNWTYAGGQREDTSTHFKLFVGGLASDIDDQGLYNSFIKFGSLSDARVMWDQSSGRSRGYGFVAYRKREDAEQALATMNGERLGSRQVRVNWANQRANLEGASDLESVLNQAHPSNTTVYVGNVSAESSEQVLRTHFSEFGSIEEIRMQKDKGFAFVRFQSHDMAARAIVGMHGRYIGSKPIKCSWGKEATATTTTPTTTMTTPPSQPPPPPTTPSPSTNPGATGLPPGTGMLPNPYAMYGYMMPGMPMMQFNPYAAYGMPYGAYPQPPNMQPPPQMPTQPPNKS
ncbi:Nucleolysin TIAR [Pelomyxa schiedti]|nr:Nucleolysin TIAR [Pelomyxa schiedti]